MWVMKRLKGFLPKLRHEIYCGFFSSFLLGFYGESFFAPSGFRFTGIVAGFTMRLNFKDFEIHCSSHCDATFFRFDRKVAARQQKSFLLSVEMKVKDAELCKFLRL